MNLYACALMLCDELARERVSLEATADGLDLCGAPSEALERRLAAFCAAPEVEGEAGELAARVERSAPERNKPFGAEQLQALLLKTRDESPPWRALTAVVRAPSRAARELLGCSVASAVKLPVPFTVTFRRRATLCVCTTSKHVYEEVFGRRPLFLMRELEAAASAAELGRASPMHLDAWLVAKSRGVSWVLTPELAGVDLPGHAPEPPSICFGELFEALGAELVDVQLHERKEAA